MSKRNHSAIKFLLLGVVLIVPGYAAIQLADHFFSIRIAFKDPQVTIGFPDESASGSLAYYPMLPNTKVRNIIFFIADGMGINHLTAARIHYHGLNGRLNIDRMPITGLLKTHAIDDLVTDSAASATAMATGRKTRNGMVGVDSAGVPLKTILEAARDSGLATGLVTSTDITDATPAAFAAHVLNRDYHLEIARQLISAKVNVLFGEGTYFDEPFKSGELDHQINGLAFAKDSGYEVVDNKDELDDAASNCVLGLFDDITIDPKSTEIKIQAGIPTLAQLTSKAIDLLNRNQKGFFLMVEEEGVDKGSHDNRTNYFLHYLKQFDDAVKVGLEYALLDSTTLVIVTSDHETGGLNIVDGTFDSKEIVFDWETENHTGQPVPLFAFGPQATSFSGMKDNTELPRIMADVLDLSNFTL